MKHLILILLVSANAHAVDTYEAREIGPEDAQPINTMDTVSPIDTSVSASPIAPSETPRRNSFRRPRTVQTMSAPTQIAQPVEAPVVTPVAPTQASPVTYDQMARETQRRDQRAVDNAAVENQRKAAGNRWAETQKLASPERQADNAAADNQRKAAGNRWAENQKLASPERQADNAAVAEQRKSAASHWAAGANRPAANESADNQRKAAANRWAERERLNSDSRQADNVDADNKRKAAGNRWAERERLNSESRQADNADADNKRKAAGNRWAENQKLNSPERQADNAAVDKAREESAQKWQQTAERQDANRQVERAEDKTQEAKANLQEASKREQTSFDREDEANRKLREAREAARAAGVPRLDKDFDPTNKETSKADRVTTAILGAHETSARDKAHGATAEADAAHAERAQAAKAVTQAETQEAAARDNKSTVEAKATPKLPTFAGGMDPSKSLQSPDAKANGVSPVGTPGANSAFNEAKLPGAPGLSGSDASSKVAQGDFRCVFGGVFVTGQDCKPARRMSQNYFGEKLESSKVTANGKTVDLAKVGCAMPIRTKGGKLLRSTDPKTGMCEAMRYGLTADGRALCAKPGKDHSQGCANEARAGGEASKAWAKAIIAQNPKAARAYASMQSRVCEENEHRANDRFSWSYQQRRRDDVAAACGLLNSRTADLGIDLKTYALKAPPVPTQVAELPAKGADAGQ